MNDSEPDVPSPSAAAPSDAAVEQVVDEAGRQLRAPWMAGLAGLIFAVLFSGAIALLRTIPILSASDAEIARWFATGGDTQAVIGGLYLAPFAGVAFLWFVAVVRDQIGEREDRFFATVFFGSGLLFVALWFAAAAIASSFVVGVQYLDQAPPRATDLAQTRALAYTLLFAFATRAAALFMFSTATVGLRSRTFPRWFALLGYLVGLVLLVVVTFFDWIVLLFPFWVAFVSLFILRRERRRTRVARPSV